MSAIGPKRTSVVAPHMSAFGGKADVTVCQANVCFWPKAGIAGVVQCRTLLSRHLHRGQIEWCHSECKPVLADRRIFAGARKTKGGRGKLIGNNFLDYVPIVTREQDDPISGAVRPSNLLLYSGRAHSGRVGQQEVGTCQSRFRCQLAEYLDEHRLQIRLPSGIWRKPDGRQRPRDASAKTRCDGCGPCPDDGASSWLTTGSECSDDQDIPWT
jgi:hypothetical protein